MKGLSSYNLFRCDQFLPCYININIKQVIVRRKGYWLSIQKPEKRAFFLDNSKQNVSP